MATKTELIARVEVLESELEEERALVAELKASPSMRVVGLTSNSCLVVHGHGVAYVPVDFDRVYAAVLSGGAR